MFKASLQLCAAAVLALAGTAHAATVNDGDFVEGVRALIIDKDERPRFAPTTLAQVRAERVQHFLSSPWRREMHPLADLGA